MNKNVILKRVQHLDELITLLRFADQCFYHLSMNETYSPVSINFHEFKEQLNIDNDFLLYLEHEQEIIGMIFGKNIDHEEKSITLGILVIKNEFRNQYYGTYLIKEFEKTCLDKGIHTINLCSRYKATGFYLKNNYNPHLFVQIYSPFTIEDIKKVNINNYPIAFEKQEEFHGHVAFAIDTIDKQDVEWFVRNAPTCNVQFLFCKELK